MPQTSVVATSSARSFALSGGRFRQSGFCMAVFDPKLNFPVLLVILILGQLVSRMAMFLFSLRIRFLQSKHLPPDFDGRSSLNSGPQPFAF
jgi:hypothetical protein